MGGDKEKMRVERLEYPDEFEEKLVTIQNQKRRYKEYMAFATFLYLTGARVSEALLMRVKDFEKRKDYPLPNGQVATYMQVRIPTLKKREVDRIINPYSASRTIPLYLSEEEKKLAKKYILDWLVERIKNDDFSSPIEQIWHFSRMTGFRICTLLGHPPHWFRHHRATMLALKYNFSPIEILEWMNWSDSSLPLVARYTKKGEIARAYTFLKKSELNIGEGTSKEATSEAGD